MGKRLGATSSRGSQTATTPTTKTGKATAKNAGAGGERGDRKGSHAEGEILRATLGPLKSSSRRNKNLKPESKMAPAELLQRAEGLFVTGRLDEALQTAAMALASIQPHGSAPTLASLKSFNLIGNIYIQQGNGELASEYFHKALELDPDGSIPESEGGGSEKFLWLAQLSEDGGHDSVRWFQKGATVLRNQIAASGDGGANTVELRKKLAAVLCSITEVYMTDLSWEEDAETQCESHITEALLIAPHWHEPLQTFASVRISQNRIDEARKALMDSMELWNYLPPHDAGVPDYSQRISLARLLMEVECEQTAAEVVRRLVQEDDQSVEAWYLGGWCLYLVGEKGKRAAEDAVMHDEAQQRELEEEIYQSALSKSRLWLQRCLDLYPKVEYQDVKLREHALELVAELDKALRNDEKDGEYLTSEGDEDDDDDDDDDDSGSQDEEDNEDEEMGES